MIDKIPAKGASDEQLAIVRARLGQLFSVAEPAPVLGHGERRRARGAASLEPVAPIAEQSVPYAERRDAAPLGDIEYLARIAYLGEIVWFWNQNRQPRAAIVTYIHLNGVVDLAIFQRTGFETRQNTARGRCNGWTPRGELE